MTLHAQAVSPAARSVVPEPQPARFSSTTGARSAGATDSTGGLTLPYHGEASTSANVLELFNTYASGGRAIYAESKGTTIWGNTTSSSGTSKGVAGTAATGYGVYAESATGRAVYATGGGDVAVYGLVSSSNGYGAYGKHEPTGNYGYLGGKTNGVYGWDNSSQGTGNGVRGDGPYSSGRLGFNTYGVWGTSTDDTGFGVYGTVSSGAAAIAVYGGSASGFAGYFSGKVHVNGVLSKSGGSFKIDHPLEPERKYLSHSFVESPDMMNIYNGNVVTDEDGLAWVELPEWFEALNRDFRYQLTVLGSGETWAQARIYRKMEHSRFQIQTSVPRTEVSWQVTGVRQDAWANAHRIPVEEDKPASDQGTYLHPGRVGTARGEGRRVGAQPGHEADTWRNSARRHRNSHSRRDLSSGVTWAAGPCGPAESRGPHLRSRGERPRMCDLTAPSLSQVSPGVVRTT